MIAFRPLGRRVLVSPVYGDGVTPSGLVLPRHSSVTAEGLVLHESHNPLYCNQGIVVALPDGNGRAFDVALDDFVIFSPYSADVVKIGPDAYIAIDEREILAVVDSDPTADLDEDDHG